MTGAQLVMRRRLSVFSLILCTALLHAAQEGPAGTGAQASTPQTGHVLLWRVVRGDSIIYLLGSVHIAKPDIYPLNDYIEDAFSQASRLVVEVDVSRIDQASFQKRVMELGTLPGGQTLRAGLSVDAARTLEEKLQDLGLPAAGLDRMRPWLAYMVLSELDLSRLGYNASNGVDLYYLGRAGDRDVVELETADFQLTLMAGFPDQDQNALLEEYLNETGLGEDTQELFDAWYAGDGARLAALIDRETGGSQAGERVRQELLRKRDAVMAAKIEELLQKPGTSFVVIGAAHLVGTGSVVDILRGDGFPVTEVGSPAF